MRLVAGAVLVVVVAGDAAVGVERAGFEDEAPRGVGDGHAQPGAPGRVGGGELVAGLVAHGHGGRETVAVHDGVADLDGGGRRAEVVGGALGGELQLLGKCGDAELGTVAVQHPQHEEVAAPEDVPGDFRPGAVRGRG